MTGLDNVDLTLPGYDNLFLVGGFNWTSKISKLHPQDFIQRGLDHAERFNLLDKSDHMKVSLWANELRHMCSEPGKPLPFVPTITDINSKVLKKIKKV